MKERDNREVRLMPKIIPPLEEITPQSFKETFHRILEVKKRAGLTPILDNPPDLFDRAKLYGIQYRNGLGTGHPIYKADPPRTP